MLKKQTVVLMMLLPALILSLTSCQSLRQTQTPEIVDYTSDIAFPTVPEIKANHADELTEQEFQSLIIYIIEAERAFDTITDREKVIKENGIL